MEITITPVSKNKKRTYTTPLGFGNEFSDHMFIQYFSEGEWKNASIEEFRSLSMSPASSVFHYGQEIFEGMKAYRRDDGVINLFRPLENLKRFNRSATRMAMPNVNEEQHLRALIKFIELDSHFVPKEPGASMYIRPTMIASSEGLGLKASDDYIHFIIAGPVGPYFEEELKPVAVYISQSDRRAVVGGVGNAKTGGNYAASLKTSHSAAQKGFSQVLWLDALSGKYIEEVGAMNIFFVYKNNYIFTPELTGSILPGITRDSVLQLAPKLGYKVGEMKMDIKSVLESIEKGEITEVFGTGTAAIIAPVGNLAMDEEDHIINNNEPGPVAKKIYRELTDIQYGRKADDFKWIKSLNFS